MKRDIINYCDVFFKKWSFCLSLIFQRIFQDNFYQIRKEKKNTKENNLKAYCQVGEGLT